MHSIYLKNTTRYFARRRRTC